ncbi:MAG: class I tRNA ligase family protein, partial [Candidatus Colwellbacteria bacterium]|nr:class I tRNA ligase family protein [Candidatus Colwellbacteria bacterium]
PGYKPKVTDFKVVAADFVKADEGTGLVHVSPAFGEEDFNLIGRDDFPVTVDDQGEIVEGLPGEGKFIKEADGDILADLKERDLIYLSERTEHEYPFCWRCATPIIYFARKSWFFTVSRLRRELTRENEKINWIPGYIKRGRFGEWIKNAQDWAISRERYWGTPLPIWRCEERHLQVIGSLEELDKYAYSKNNFFLLRHGGAEHNVSGLMASGPEEGERVSHLTANGVGQAEETAKELRRKKIDFIFTSPYARTRETAEIVARRTGAEVIADERLGEVNAGVLNWRRIEEYQNFFGGLLERFTKTPEGGENWLDVKRRVSNFILDINNRYQSKNILIVSHGAPLR